MEGMAHTVYQYYDSQGVLLYVGVTSRAFVRSHEHAHTKMWWHLTAGCHLEHFADRQQALEREAELIRRYRPPFNKQLNKAPVPYTGDMRTVADVEHGRLHGRRGAWYDLSREERMTAPCVQCGKRPGWPHGPTCDVCMAERRARRAA